MGMREEIAAIAGPFEWSDNRKSWLSRVPDKVERLTGAQLSLRLIKAAWHNEITEKHWAALELHRAVAIIEYERELAKVKQRHEVLVHRMASFDKDFRRPTVTQMFGDLRRLRGKNRA